MVARTTAYVNKSLRNRQQVTQALAPTVDSQTCLTSTAHVGPAGGGHVLTNAL